MPRPQPGMPQPGMPQPAGMPQPGMPQPGMPQQPGMQQMRPGPPQPPMPAGPGANYQAQAYKLIPSVTEKNPYLKEQVGHLIYDFVQGIIGVEKAPKITGMLIDLPEAELNFSISQWNHFEQKVMSALQLITQSHQDPNQAADPTSQAPAGASSEGKGDGVQTAQ